MLGLFGLFPSQWEHAQSSPDRNNAITVFPNIAWGDIKQEKAKSLHPSVIDMLPPPLAHSLLHSSHSSVQQRSDKTERGGSYKVRDIRNVGGCGNDETSWLACDKPHIEDELPSAPPNAHTHTETRSLSIAPYGVVFDDKKRTSESACDRYEVLTCITFTGPKFIGSAF